MSPTAVLIKCQSTQSSNRQFEVAVMDRKLEKNERTFNSARQIMIRHISPSDPFQKSIQSDHFGKHLQTKYMEFLLMN